MSSKKAFTLSEVLLAIVIVGIIAGITVPSLMLSTNKAAYISGYKKAFSVLQVSIDKYSSESGSDFSFLIKNGRLNDLFVKKYLNSSAIFGDENNLRVMTADGILYSFHSVNTNCDTDLEGWSYDDISTGNLLEKCCYLVSIDVNGNKKPNTDSTISKFSDRYTVFITPKDVFPDEVGRKILYNE